MNNNCFNNNYNHIKYDFNTTKINSTKINGIFTKYKFELKYPDNINGVIEPTEFNNTIKSINDKISTILPSTFYIYLIPIFIGILVIIAGLNSSLLWFGIVLIVLSLLSLIINIVFFQNNVEEKIIEQLRIINQNYRERIIIWSLHTEVVYKSVNSYDLQFNKNKNIFKSKLVYDDSGNPYESRKDMYILIAFPSSYNNNCNNNYNNKIINELDQLSFQLPIFDIIPNYENFNYYSINNNNNLSISMNSLY